VLGYSYLEQNGDRVRGIPLNGIAPSAATIQNFTYPGSRKLYLYVKGEHLDAIPGMRLFLTAYSQAWSPGGYLVQRGLIPLPDADRAAALAIVQNPHPLTAADVH
jgi:phosphate transport system substrate-binding protein